MQTAEARARESGHEAPVTAEQAPTADADSAAAQRGQAQDLRLDGFLAGGSEASPLDSGMRGRAEQSLGVDLGGVRVHQGEQASAANSQLGSRAFAHGSDVVLGAGASNSANPVMAHELAHVAQQQGAAPGVAMLSERGARGSAHEVDADQAAAAIMIGAPAKVSQVGAESIMCFEGAEHMDLGNAAYNDQQVTVGGVTLPAGAFTAMQGDFFGTWAELERTCTSNPALIMEYYGILQREGRLRAAHLRDPANNPEPDSNGPIMLAGRGARATEYLGLASANFNHFSDQSADSDALFDGAATMNAAYKPEIDAAKGKFGMNIGQWLTMHLSAGQRAFLDGMQGKPFGGAAVAMDAGALHYLTDAFAAGHMRTPRTAMAEEYKRVFKAAARAEVGKLVDPIPNSLDVTSWIRQGIAAASPAMVRGVTGWVGDQIPAMSISLVAMKTAIRAKLNPVADQIGEAIASSVAGFSAKVLHDYDNEHGVEAFNDAGEHWVSKGDHNLAGSAENEKIAIAASTASATHMHQLHAAGVAKKGAANATREVMPFISLAPITSRLPQMTDATKNEGTTPGGARDWHWATMNPTYRAQVKQNAINSVKDTVASATDALKEKVREAVQAAIASALSTLGHYTAMIQAYAGAIVDKIMDYVGSIDPTVLINAILR
ncbi:MAG: DUF4157 domain-containing protein [Myxococcales bacterium]|nr:DUF4157 domain-containing protein [Myxococcales bacterium]